MVSFHEIRCCLWTAFYVETILAASNFQSRPCLPLPHKPQNHADLAAVDWPVPKSLARAPKDHHLLGRGMQIPFKNCPARLKYSCLLFCHWPTPQTSEPFWEADGQGDCQGCKPNCTTAEQVDIAQKQVGHAEERFTHEHPMIA